jgi:hypothetical protein
MIFNHERHHSINAVLNLQAQEQQSRALKQEHLLSSPEFGKKGTQWALEDSFKNADPVNIGEADKLARIKDEIMAYLVGGTDPREIKEYLERPSYAHLFQIINLDPKRRYQVQDALKEIGIQLHYMLQLDKSENARQKLAYHLVDVPFDKILDYLRRLHFCRESINLAN